MHWLFAESQGRRLLIPKLDLSPTSYSVFSVRDPVVRSGDGPPGDIDVLVIDPDAPQHATAIECKRLKVRAGTFETLLPGKLQGLRKGVHQANGLLAMGFHRTFLAILVVTDGRERDAFNFAFRGLTPELVRAVDTFPDRERLEDAVGLVFIEITQPIDKDIALASDIGVRVLRHPMGQQQPADLDDRLRELVRWGGPIGVRH